MARLTRLWRNLTRPDAVERDLDDELRATLELMVEERLRTGLAPAEARRAARLELGVESVKQQVREVRAGAVLDTLARDLCHAGRLLRRNPVFAVTAVLSLAIGIGATTAVFTVANGVLLRAAAGVADPGTLVDIVRRDPTDGPGVELMSFPDLLDVRRETSTLDGVFGYQLQITPASLRLADSTAAAYVNVVTSNYFDTLRVLPAVGRVFDAGDGESAGASPVAVLSHHYWLRRFSGDRGIVGQTVRINGVPVTIGGVAAAGFKGLSVVAPDLWLPPSMLAIVSPEGKGQELTNRQIPWLMLGARLRNGVSRAQASSEMAVIGAAIQRDTPPDPFVVDPPEGAREIDPKALVWSVEAASPIPYGVRVIAAEFLGLLMALVGVVLGIACANLAGVLLARATARRREIAVRTAVGAARVRIVRQLLTETALLYVLGGVAGLALARVVTTLLVALLPEFPVPVTVSVPLDLRVVVFVLVVSLIAAVLAGLAPALHGSRTDVVTALKDDAQGPRDRLRLRNAFVVAQIAGSILLVITAGLLVRAFDNVVSVQQGLDPRGVEVASLDLTMGGYTNETGPSVIRRLRERVRAIPGVEHASIADRAPGAGGRSFGTITVPGEAPPGSARVRTNWTLVEPGYFETVRVPLMAGRDFTDADSGSAERVVIVAERTARRLWPADDPIGRLVLALPPDAGDPEIARLNSRAGGTPPPATQMRVVGVARDLTSGGQGESAPLVVYVPFQQRYLAQATTLVRGERVVNLAQEIRAAVEAVDPNLPVLTVEPLERQGSGPVQTQLRIAATVAGSVGVVGLFLAGIGIYGVTAYAVTQRTREIGIRLSLGAGRGDVIAMVLREGMMLVAIGSGIGLALGLGAGRLLSGRQFGIPQADPVVLAAAAVIFTVVGLVACYVPVRRAVSIRATDALRCE